MIDFGFFFYSYSALSKTLVSDFKGKELVTRFRAVGETDLLVHPYLQFELLSFLVFLLSFKGKHWKKHNQVS